MLWLFIFANVLGASGNYVALSIPAESQWGYDDSIWTTAWTSADTNGKTAAFNYACDTITATTTWAGVTTSTEWTHNLKMPLNEIFASGTWYSSSLSTSTWRDYIGSGVAPWQNYCNTQGFNVNVASVSKARFGIVMNQENDCNSPDTAIGVGVYHRGTLVGSGTGCNCCQNGGTCATYRAETELYVSNCYVSNQYAAVNTVAPNYVITSPLEYYWMAGETVMLIQMKGSTIDTSSIDAGEVVDMNSAGNYEFLVIESINEDIVYFTTDIVFTYDPSGAVQLVLLPSGVMYGEELTFNEEIIVDPFDGSTGGIVAIVATGAIYLNADINVQQAGFRGGSVSTDTEMLCGDGVVFESDGDTSGAGYKGESIYSGIYGDNAAGMGRQANGGGGGIGHNSGGGGGANYGAGGDGSEYTGCASYADSGAFGGQSLSSYISSTKMFFGGGGGGGEQNNAVGTSGTAGGGIIFIQTPELFGNSHTLNAQSGTNTGTGNDGSGGGGAGGTVVLNVLSIGSNLVIMANGGNGADTGTCHSVGGGGGGGVIMHLGAAWPVVSGVSVTTDVSGGLKGSWGTCDTTGMDDGSDGATGFILGDLAVSQSVPICGDGIVQLGEACDDAHASDGCASDCSYVVEGWICTDGVGCQACGTGVREYFEDCDDGNLINGDGCDDTCAIEDGFTCFGSVDVPDVCSDGEQVCLVDEASPYDCSDSLSIECDTVSSSAATSVGTTGIQTTFDSSQGTLSNIILDYQGHWCPQASSDVVDADGVVDIGLQVTINGNPIEGLLFATIQDFSSSGSDCTCSSGNQWHRSQAEISLTVGQQAEVFSFSTTTTNEIGFQAVGSYTTTSGVGKTATFWAAQVVVYLQYEKKCGNFLREEGEVCDSIVGCGLDCQEIYPGYGYDASAYRAPLVIATKLELEASTDVWGSLDVIVPANRDASGLANDAGDMLRDDVYLSTTVELTNALYYPTTWEYTYLNNLDGVMFTLETTTGDWVEGNNTVLMHINDMNGYVGTPSWADMPRLQLYMNYVDWTTTDTITFYDMLLVESAYKECLSSEIGNQGICSECYADASPSADQSVCECNTGFLYNGGSVYEVIPSALDGSLVTLEAMTAVCTALGDGWSILSIDTSEEVRLVYDLVVEAGIDVEAGRGVPIAYSYNDDNTYQSLRSSFTQVDAYLQAQFDTGVWDTRDWITNTNAENPVAGFGWGSNADGLAGIHDWPLSSEPSAIICEHDGADSWVMVATEEAGAIAYSVNNNLDALRNLDIADLPSYVAEGDYYVKLEWGVEYIEFHVPAGSNIFDQTVELYYSVDSIVTSPDLSVDFGDTGFFCHACINDPPGDPVAALVWTEILQYGSSAYPVTSSASGDLSTDASSGFAKLSDSDINAIPAGDDGYFYYYFTTADPDFPDTDMFLRTTNSYDDLAVGLGLGTWTACSLSSLEDCWTNNGFTYSNTAAYFEYRPSNDHTRWFADYYGQIGCFNLGDPTQRCWTAGQTVDHVIRTDVTVYKLASGAVCQVLDETGCASCPGFLWNGRACIDESTTMVGGDTCWALTPDTDANRACGCNSGSWSGTGAYYGGRTDAVDCGPYQGGWAGDKISGQQKGDLDSLGLNLYVRPAAVDLGCFEIIGDGLIVGTEQCDDGNEVDGDGCSQGLIDNTYVCEGEPSECSRIGAPYGTDAGDSVDECGWEDLGTHQDSIPYGYDESGNLGYVTRGNFNSITDEAECRDHCSGDPDVLGYQLEPTRGCWCYTATDVTTDSFYSSANSVYQDAMQIDEWIVESWAAGNNAAEFRRCDAISFAGTVRFYGVEYDSVWINHNGVLSFGGPQEGWDGVSFSDYIGQPIIAAFYSLWDMSCDDGAVWYRHLTSGAEFDEYELLLSNLYGFDETEATDVLIVTYYGERDQAGECSGEMNFNQVVLVASPFRTFVLFMYSRNSVLWSMPVGSTVSAMVGVHGGSAGSTFLDLTEGDAFTLYARSSISPDYSGIARRLVSTDSGTYDGFYVLRLDETPMQAVVPSAESGASAVNIEGSLNDWSFSQFFFDYDLEVERSTSATFTAYLVDPDASIYIDGVRMYQGVSSVAYDWPADQFAADLYHTVVVQIVASDGSSSDYNFNIYMILDTNTGMNEIGFSVDGATASQLTYLSSSQVYLQTLEVDGNAQSIVMTPTATSQFSIVSFAGVLGTESSDSPVLTTTAQSIAYGHDITTTYLFIVTAEDGSQSTYTLNVLMLLSNSLDHTVSTDIGTASASASCDVDVTSLQDSIVMTVDATGFNSEVIWYGGTFDGSVSITDTFTLDLGENLIQYRVRAENSAYESTEEYCVNRIASSVNSLISLTIEEPSLGYDSGLAFDSATSSYTVAVDNFWESINFFVTREDDASSVNFVDENGEVLASGDQLDDFVLPVSLEGSTTVIQVQVTAQDGSVNTYTVSIEAAAATELGVIDIDTCLTYNQVITNPEHHAFSVSLSDAGSGGMAVTSWNSVWGDWQGTQTCAAGETRRVSCMSTSGTSLSQDCNLGEMSYDEAVSYCENDRGGRLPTLDEVVSGGIGNMGCAYDAVHEVWTSTLCGVGYFHVTHASSQDITFLIYDSASNLVGSQSNSIVLAFVPFDTYYITVEVDPALEGEQSIDLEVCAGDMITVDQDGSGSASLDAGRWAFFSVDLSAYTLDTYTFSLTHTTATEVSLMASTYADPGGAGANDVSSAMASQNVAELWWNTVADPLPDNSGDNVFLVQTQSTGDSTVIVGVYGPATGTASFDYVFAPPTPEILVVVANSLETSGGTPVTIYGNYFELVETPAYTSVDIGGSACSALQYDALGGIVCYSPAGEGAPEMTMTIYGVTSNPYVGLSYGGPTISRVIASSTALTNGNFEIVITGTRFGQNPTVTFGAVLCTDVAASSDSTSISCTMGEGSGSGTIEVTVSGQTATFPFSYANPAILSLSADDSSTVGDGQLTLTGTSMGAADATVSVTVGEQDCVYVSHSHTSVVCTLPANAGSQDVIVTVSDLTSNTRSFTYGGPTVTGVTPDPVPAAATSVVISGTNFGPSDGAPEVTLLGGTCTVTDIANHNEITCDVPARVDTLETVGTVSVLGASTAFSLSYIPPAITSISPTTIDTSGEDVVLTGTNFQGSNPVVFWNGVEIIPDAADDTTISFAAPAGSGAAAEVMVSVGGLNSELLHVDYTAPVVDSVTSEVDNALAFPLRVTVSGSQFGPSTAAIVVSIDGRVCEIESFTQTEIVCLPTAASGENLVVVITSSGQDDSSDATFSFPVPNIENVQASNYPTRGGTLVTLTGSFFGEFGSGSVNVGIVSGDTITDGKLCTVFSTSWSQSQIQCYLPAWQGTKAFVVTTSGVDSNYFEFSYNTPVITDISPQHTTSPGSVITITGTDFSTDTDCPNNCGITVNGLDCPDSVHTSTQIQCTLPDGAGGTVDVVVSIDGASVTASYTYLPPTLTELSTVLMTTNAGSGGNEVQELVITGTSLGYSASVTSVSVTSLAGTFSCSSDDSSCFTERTHTSVTVGNVFNGVGLGAEITLTIGEQTSLPLTFDYEPPTLTGISGCENDDGTGCALGGLDTITLTGTNFGPDPDLITITITSGDGLENCGSVTLVDDSGTQVTCVTPEGRGLEVPLSITVGEQTVLAPFSFGYLGPVITGGTLGLSGGSTSTALDLTDITATCQLSGQFFKPDGAQSPIVTCGPTGSEYATTLVSATNTQVEFSLPASAAGTNLACIVYDPSTEQYSVASTDVILLPKPEWSDSSLTLSSLDSPSAEVTGTASSGDIVRMDALYVGDDASIITIFYSNDGSYTQECTEVFVVSFDEPTYTTTLRCQMGDSNGRDNLFVVHVNGWESDPSSFVFHFPATPEITSVRAYAGSSCVDDDSNGVVDCPTIGGERIYVNGKNFQESESAAVYINQLRCTDIIIEDVSDAESTTVSCVVPSTVGLGVSISISFSFEFFSPTYYGFVSYKAPSLATLSGCTADGETTIDCDRNGNDRLTITGENFGVSDAYVLVGGRLCANPVHNTDNPHSELECEMPTGVGRSASVIIVQNGGTLSATQIELAYAQCQPGFYEASDVDYDCTACAGGTYTSAPSATSCLLCQSGTWSDVAGGSSTCVDCLSGTYSTLSDGDIIGPVLCDDCAAGRYASVTGMADCVDCPVGKHALTDGLSECHACIVGRYAATTGMLDCVDCSPGYFSAIEGQDECDACSIGTYTPNDASSTCLACEAGSRQASEGQASCDDCAEGKAQQSVGQMTCLACNDGTYTNETGLASCNICQPGTVSTQPSATEGATSCDVCPTGTYMNAYGQAVCLACRAGTFADTEGSAECSSCPVGKFSLAGASDCAECAAGTFTSNTGSDACTDCTAGRYSVDGSSTCEPCAAGTVAGSAGTATCTPCDHGTVALSTGLASCSDCEAGSYSLGIGSYQACTNCEPGKAQILPGQSECIECEAGSFVSLSGAMECSVCDAGKYSSASGADVCTSCTAGTYCPAGATGETPCRSGTYTNSPGLGTCLSCGPGTFGMDEGSQECVMCDAGNFVEVYEATECVACDAGTFAYSAGASTCEVCTPGKYANDTGSSECMNCAPGTVGTGGSACTSCEPGTYYAASGGITCTLCDVGWYNSESNSIRCLACEEGTVQPSSGQTECNDCPMGSYMNSLGQAVCIECDAGMYANDTAMSECTRCSEGSYSVRNSDGTGASACTLCAAGLYTNSPGQDQCLDCPLGKYADADGTVDCQGCAPGTYTGEMGMQACTDCEPGRHTAVNSSYVCLDCLFGTYTRVAGQTVCSDCATGRAQSSSGTTSCSECEVGAVASSTGLAFCEACGAGEFMAHTGGIYCDVCSTGQYQQSTGSSSCDICGVGTYQSGIGQLVCMSCDAGRYSNANGTSTCNDCAIGTFQSAAGQSSCDVCPEGTANPSRSQSACVACDPGTYAATNASETCDDCSIGRVQAEYGTTGCNDCATGTYQASIGQAVCSACPAGTYTGVAGSTACAPCSTGYYQGSEGQADCLMCSAGFYSSYTGAVECSQCAAGHYSGQAAVSCGYCVAGEYQDAVGQSNCKNCSMGTFSNGIRSTECTACEAGFFNDQEGATACTACAAGLYQNTEGGASCDMCQAGRYTPILGQADCWICEAGSYSSQDGAVGCDLCSVGRYSSIAGGSSCMDCATGSYQSTEGSLECSLCSPGYFTNETGLSTCYVCAAGSSSISGEATCRLCEAGTYSPVEGSGSCSICSTGKYSAFGSSVCTDCELGRSQGVAQSSACDICDVGRYSPSYGGSSCLLCGFGQYSNLPEASGCKSCDVGTFGPLEGSSECIDCSQGEYQDSRGQFECKRCPAGSAGPFTGSETCMECNPGTFQSTDAQTTCLACEAGTYAITRGTTSCLNCDIGRYQPFSNATACEACPEGYYQDNERAFSCLTCTAGTYSQQAAFECSDCPAGSVAPKSASAECFVCDTNSVPNDESTQCLCDIGYAALYTNNSDTGLLETECMVCPDGSVCDFRGAVYNEIEAAIGYWEGDDGTFYRCLLAIHCEGGDDGEQCAANREGALCAQCADGYTESSLSGECEVCNTSGGALGWTIVFGVLACLILVLNFWFVLSTAKPLLEAARVEDKILAQQAGKDVIITDEERRKVVTHMRYGRILTIFGPPSPKPEFLYKLKILLSFLQILTTLSLSLEIDYPTQFIAFVNLFNPANLDIISLTSADCIADVNYYSELYFWLVVPVVIILSIWLVIVLPYITCRKKNDNHEQREQKKEQLRKFWRLTMFSLFLVYPSVSSTIFSIFVCKKVEDVSYLQSDFSLQCGDEQWTLNAYVAGAFIFVYPFGIPAFLYYMLRRYRYGKNGGSRLEEKGIRAELGFMYDCFDNSAWYFELCDMLHKLVVTSLIAFVPWEAQLSTCLGVLWVYLCVILVLNPYVRKGDDMLHLVVQIELMLIVMAGMVFNTAEVIDPVMEAVLSVVLIAMCVIIFCWFVASVFTALKKKMATSKSDFAVALRQGQEAHMTKISVRDQLALDLIGADFQQDRAEITSERQRAVVVLGSEDANKIGIDRL